ncbi:MAG: CBS domain-containing protein [Prochloraceae cyanobacterium]|nr:CBS domain-containing protein [Prochloraceae cyanobacterium]
MTTTNLPTISNLNLSLQAATIDSLVRLSPETKVKDAIEQIKKKETSCLLASQASLAKKEEQKLPLETNCIIAIEEDRLVGIFTPKDIVKLVAMGIDLDKISVAEVMTRNWIVLRESDYYDIFTVVNLFRQHNARHIVIVSDNNDIVGLITPESTRKILRNLPHLKLQSVKRVMNPGPIAVCANTPLSYVFSLAIEQQTDCIAIVKPPNDSGLCEPIGLISEQDLIQLQGLELDLDEVEVEAVMSSCEYSLTAEDSLWKAQQEMERSQKNWLLVTGTNGELVGTISTLGILLATDSLEIYQKVWSLEQKIAELEKEKELLLENRSHS